MTLKFDDRSWRSIQETAHYVNSFQQKIDMVGEVASVLPDVSVLDIAKSVQTIEDTLNRYLQQFQLDDHSWRSIQETVQYMASYQRQIDDVTAAVSLITDTAASELTKAVQAAQDMLTIDMGALNAYLQRLMPTLEREPDEREVLEHPETDLARPDIQKRIIISSPIVLLLEQLRSAHVSLHSLHWRQLEELVADLLSQAGYTVHLGPGSKDNGVDIFAIKEDPITGFFLAVWQAKKLQPGNKVDIHVIRELADTRQQYKASKGIIVTTTSLTRDALTRIEQDRYHLGKVDGDDLLSWIRGNKQA